MLSEFHLMSASNHVVLNGSYVELIDVFGGVLRQRTYHGERKHDYAKQQAKEWSDRYQVPVRTLGRGKREK